MGKVLYIDNWPGINLLNVSSNGLGASIFKLTAMTDAFEAGFTVDLLTSPLKAQLLDQAYGLHTIYTDVDNVLFDYIRKL